MELETLRKKLFDTTNLYNYDSLDELILDIVNNYAVEMCEEQKKLCAKNAWTDESLDGMTQEVSEESILGANLPNELD
jgi:hypothetical protein